MNLDSPTPSAPVATDTVLQVYLLGLVEFEAALALQRRLVYQVSGTPGSGALVLCEHPPLITVGREGSWAHILCEPTELRARQWRVRWVNRGGGCLLHLPGQLAIYPVVSLNDLNIGLQSYLDRLQQVLTAVLDDFSVRGETRPGQAGVWVGARAIASVGVAVRDWVTYYGAALNIKPSLDLFRLVRSHLSANGHSMTSLERERRGPLSISLVRERLIEHFAAQFHFSRTTLFFDDPHIQNLSRREALPERAG